MFLDHKINRDTQRSDCIIYLNKCIEAIALSNKSTRKAIGFMSFVKEQYMKRNKSSNDK